MYDLRQQVQTLDFERCELKNQLMINKDENIMGNVEDMKKRIE